MSCYFCFVLLPLGHELWQDHIYTYMYAVLVVVSLMLYSGILCISLSMDLFVLCAACLTIFLGVVIILFLNVMELLNVGGGALMDIPCIVFQSVCVVPVIPVCI